MSLDFVAEVWDALRTHIDFNDRGDAADTLINLLIIASMLTNLYFT